MAATSLIDLQEVRRIREEFAVLQREHEVLEDGILDIERYRRSKVRILWILKQAPHVGEYHLAEWLAKASGDGIAASPTWRRMAYAGAGILRGISFEEARALPQAEIVDSLMSTAVIEVQKELGDWHTPRSILAEGYRKYGALVKRQVKAYAPDIIIVAMGEEWIRKEIVEDIYSACSGGAPYRINGEGGLDNTNIKVRGAETAYTYANGVSFLWTTHPQYSVNIGDRDYYDALCGAYRKSLNIRRKK